MKNIKINIFEFKNKKYKNNNKYGFKAQHL